MAARNRGKKRGNKRVNNQGHNRGNTKGKDGGNTKGKDGGNTKGNVGGNKKIDPDRFLCKRCNKQWEELEPFNAHINIWYKTGQCPVEKKK